ncbi:MAG: DUF721 domain-containing protein [Gammaproteobacteria bacterium]|nr:DUF721 domain-containing protein [Gammaproteobacteria bacterium]
MEYHNELIETMPKLTSQLNPKTLEAGQSPARSGRPEEIRGLLTRSGLAQAAQKFAGQQRDWNDFFSEKLAADLLAAIVNFVERDGTLTIHVSSASWAARLRLALPDLADEVRTFRDAVKKVVVKVQPVAASTGART